MLCREEGCLGVVLCLVFVCTWHATCIVSLLCSMAFSWGAIMYWKGAGAERRPELQRTLVVLMHWLGSKLSNTRDISNVVSTYASLRGGIKRHTCINGTHYCHHRYGWRRTVVYDGSVHVWIRWLTVMACSADRVTGFCNNVIKDRHFRGC